MKTWGAENTGEKLDVGVRERENGPEARQGLGAESYKGRYREKEEK